MTDGVCDEDLSKGGGGQKQGPGSGSVSSRGIGLLAVYLVCISCLMIYGIFWQWLHREKRVGSGDTGAGVSLEAPKASTALPLNKETIPAGYVLPLPHMHDADRTAAPVTLDAVSPRCIPAGMDAEVIVRGKGISEGAVALFGGLPGVVVGVAPGGLSMSVRPPPHLQGVVDVAVRNPDGSSDVLMAAITFMNSPIRESSLFLMVVFAGGLGGALHGLRSLIWYVGNRCLLTSWVLMYLLLPLTGALMAMIFYLVVRAGFMPTQTSSDASHVIIAISALVGLFSQQAALKLNDIANAVLTKPGQGTDPMPQPSLSTGGGTTERNGSEESGRQ